MTQSSQGSRYLIGLSRLNKHDMALIKLAMDCIQTIKRGDTYKKTGAVIRALSIYSEEHFGIEELNLEKTGTGNITSHKLEHEWFVQKINAYEESYFNGREPSIEEITDFLINWIRNHMLKSDKDSFPIETNQH